MGKSRLHSFALLIGISIVCMIPSFICILHKSQFHIDEVWTYALSNSTYSPYLYVWRTGIGDDSVPTRYSTEESILSDTENAFFQQWHTGKEFKDYITVQEGEQFQYSTVFYNQSCDVHPPLYYIIVHTICSLFPDAFSKWFAFVPNMVFMVGCIYVLFCIGSNLGLNKTRTMIAIIFWALSRAGISDMVFLRMYMMLTFITLLSLLLHLRLNSRECKRDIIIVFLVNLCGFLTQYYYYIFCFFLTAVFCIYFFVRKKVLFSIVYGCSVLASVGLAILIFPATLKQVFNGAYTDSSAIRAESVWGIASWFDVLIRDFIGGSNTTFHLLLIIIIFTLIILGYFRSIKNAKIQNMNTGEYLRRRIFCRRSLLYWLVFIIVILTASLIGIVSPMMPLYQDRYLFCIIPVFAIYFIDMIITASLRVMKRTHREKYRSLFVVVPLLILILSSNIFPRNNYIDYDNNETDLADILKDETCFLVLQQEYRIHTYPIYLQYAERVFVSDFLNDKLFSEINQYRGDKAYILVQYSVENAVEDIIERAEYNVSILDDNIETTLGYMGNDTLLFVDYSKPKKQ